MFCLTATAETIHYRITRGSPSCRSATHAGRRRPRWNVSASCLSERAPAYAQAHHAVATDDRTPEQVADEVLRIFETTVTASLPTK